MKKDEMSRILISLMHSLFCKADHENVCEFYDEIELADCWDLPSVETWVTITMLAMEALKLDESKMIAALQKVSRQLSSIAALSEPERRLLDAIYRESDLSFLIPEVSPSSSEPAPQDSVGDSCLLSQEYLALLSLSDRVHK